MEYDGVGRKRVALRSHVVLRNRTGRALELRTVQTPHRRSAPAMNVFCVQRAGCVKGSPDAGCRRTRVGPWSGVGAPLAFPLGIVVPVARLLR